MGKLHQVLAVEESLGAVFKTAAKEAVHAFEKKGVLFEGHTTEDVPYTEDVASEVTPIRPQSEEVLITSTVTEKLAFLGEHFGEWIKAVAQKEITNTQARANVTIGETTYVLPPTLLLSLESRLKLLRDVVMHVPTREMKTLWNITDRAGVFRATPATRQITRKIERYKVVIEPSEHQPGQFATFTEDVPVGERRVTHYSGKWTSQQKSDCIARIDELIRKVKQARQAANEQPINDEADSLGDALLNHVFPD